MNDSIIQKSALAALLALAASAAGAAELALGLAPAYDSPAGLGIAAEARAEVESFGPLLSARAAASCEGMAAASGAATGSARALAELSASSGSIALVATAEGGAEADYAGGSWDAGGRLSVAVNGLDASFSLAPRAAYSGGDAAGLELGLLLGSSFLVGDSLLKPGVDLSWSRATDGSGVLAVTPSFGFSWFPGIPLSTSLEAGFERRWEAKGAATDHLPLAASIYGAAGGSFLFSASGRATLALADASFDDVLVELRASTRLGSLGKGELTLPASLSWSPDPAAGLSARLGLRWELD